MRGTHVFLLLPLAAAIAVPTLGAAPSLVPSGGPVPRLAQEEGILWNQTSDDSGVGIVSQNFGESSFDRYDNQGADDFIVPEGEVWILTGIEARGTHFAGGSGPLDSMNVVVYRTRNERPGRPGGVVRNASEQPATPINTGVDYLVTLSDSIKLKPGRYWLSLQGNMYFALGGEWGWETSRTQRGSPSVWRNPGDGFATGCIDYQRQVHCVGELGQGPDFMFVLLGKRKLQL